MECSNDQELVVLLAAVEIGVEARMDGIAAQEAGLVKGANMQLGRLIAASLFAVAANYAHSQSPTDATVLGLTLGAPFTMPECRYSALTKTINSYDGELKQKNTPCWMHENFMIQPGEPLANPQRVKILLPPDVTPRGVRYTGITGVVLDGNLESVSMLTTGESSQDSLFALLSEKYGQPTAKGLIPVQNRLGASFQSITAEWKNSRVVVSFVGVAYRIDAGLISVHTPKGKATTESMAEKNKAAAPKF